MTIIAFHYTKDGTFAISDGLISRGQNRVLEQTQKIIQFNPEYKIPIISLGRLNHFTPYRGGNFCICFAGNYSIISSVITKFIEIVTRKLVLDRSENGVPTVYQREDEGRGLKNHSYWDDYNFSSNEFIPITVNFLVNILQRVASSVCADFSKNAMQNPELELLLFGEQTVDNKRTNLAQVLICKEFVHPNPIFQRFSVLPWTLTCIGDSSIIPTLIADIEFDPSFRIDTTMEQSENMNKWIDSLSANHKIEHNRIKAIKKGVMKIVQSGSRTIGGDCSLAYSSWTSDLSISTIKFEEIEEKMAND